MKSIKKNKKLNLSSPTKPAIQFPPSPSKTAKINCSINITKPNPASKFYQIQPTFSPSKNSCK